MRQRTTFMIMVLFLFSAVTAVAQPRQGERGNREDVQTERMKEELGLTADQAAKVKAILKRSREETQAEFGNSDGDREARREAMMKRQEKNDAEIMKLLTPEQKKKYEEMKKERRKQMEERRRARD
ncbi:MAG: hypothetical protein HUU02_03045 [Bacteroidetes bacterium]|nr:hypothetical protein [Bacteroidota bacterium]